MRRGISRVNVSYRCSVGGSPLMSEQLVCCSLTAWLSVSLGGLASIEGPRKPSSTMYQDTSLDLSVVARAGLDWFPDVVDVSSWTVAPLSKRCIQER